LIELPLSYNSLGDKIISSYRRERDNKSWQNIKIVFSIWKMIQNKELYLSLRTCKTLLMSGVIKENDQNWIANKNQYLEG
jgi:hypothetical protein